MANMHLLYHHFQDTKLALITDCNNFAMSVMLQEVSAHVQKPL